MRFSTTCEPLSNAMKSVCSICNKKTSLQALSSCVIEAVEPDKIFISATNLDTTLRLNLTASVEEAGSVRINAKRFFDSISLQPKDNEVIVTTDGGNFKLQVSKYKAKLSTADDDAYPTLPTDEYLKKETHHGIIIDAMRFKAMLESVVFSISQDEARPDFCGLNFMFSKEDAALDVVNMALCSTDGHRLSLASENLLCDAIPSELGKPFIVPLAGINELLSNIQRGDILITCSGNQAVFQTNEWILMSSLINGMFPDFTRVIPDWQEEQKIEFEADDLMPVLKQAEKFSTEQTATIMSFTKSELGVYARNPQMGEMEDSIQCSYIGEDVKIGVNCKFFMPILKSLAGKRLVIQALNPDSPVRIEPVKQMENDDGTIKSSCTYIVMPMQF